MQKKIGLRQGSVLTRNAIETWQLHALRDTIRHATQNSAFYKHKLQGYNLPDFLTDIENFPFTNADDIAQSANDFLCVPASNVSRVVTLETSGTTGHPKRIFFTEEDQELMVDFIAHEMAPMVSAGETFLVLMPCKSSGSVGDLVRIGLTRIGVRVIPYGLLRFDGSEDKKILALMKSENVRSILATASTALRLANASINANIHLRSLLLSAEYVSEKSVSVIERAFGAKVFEHYGMTEMGLGGAVSCGKGEGYHVREADLLFEVIDPATGKVLPDGETGELVFTTLTRKAMPLIRYRTGDFGKWLQNACPCGSLIRRLGRVEDRRILKGY